LLFELIVAVLDLGKLVLIPVYHDVLLLQHNRTSIIVSLTLCRCQRQGIADDITTYMTTFAAGGSRRRRSNTSHYSCRIIEPDGRLICCARAPLWMSSNLESILNCGKAYVIEDCTDTNCPSSIIATLNRRRQILRRRNAHTLAVHVQRNRQQTKHSHDHAKDAERKSRAVGNNPVSDEERPRERDDGADDGCHDEAVAVHRLVGVDDLDTC